MITFPWLHRLFTPRQRSRSGPEAQTKAKKETMKIVPGNLLLSQLKVLKVTAAGSLGAVTR